MVLVPIADEKAFLDLLDRLNFKADKGKDDVYTVKPEGLQVEIYFRFAHKYAYATALNKSAIAKDKLLEPAKVLPEGEMAALTVVARLDRVPNS